MASVTGRAHRTVAAFASAGGFTPLFVPDHTSDDQCHDQDQDQTDTDRPDVF